MLVHHGGSIRVAVRQKAIPDAPRVVRHLRASGPPSTFEDLVGDVSGFRIHLLSLSQSIRMPRQIDRNPESGPDRPHASPGLVSRRDSLRSALGLLAAPLALGMAPPVRGVRSFQLAEPSGLRRFGYPVHALVPDAAGGRNFRLVRDGRAIPAQFRTVEGPGDRREVALDFIASPAPLETARYEVHFGPEVEPGPEPKGGMKVEIRDGRYFISQGSSMTFEVAEDLAGFLRSVGSPRLGYLRDDLGRSSMLRENGVSGPTRQIVDRSGRDPVESDSRRTDGRRAPIRVRPHPAGRPRHSN